MKFVDEYREPRLAKMLLERIRSITTKRWTIMEVCGGQTHGLLKYGIDQLLPEGIRLVHGPGCPVCVTALERIDHALAIAARAEVTFCSFGDMLRVPGSTTDLLQLRAQGADVRIVYSPLDAVRLAKENPHRQVVFFAVGFETTAPATALAVSQAKAMALQNFSLISAHVRVPPAMELILASEQCQIQGFLAAGHVCTVVGMSEYYPIAEKYRVPIVVTGFEPVDLLEGIAMVIEQLEHQQHEVTNQYRRVVQASGNPQAQKIVQEVYETCDRAWRGLGIIPASGLRLNEKYREFDAEGRFARPSLPVVESELCHSGAVLQGIMRPDECPAFGKECTPENPLGAPMVSTEGACAAYWKYRKMPRLVATN